MKKQLLLLSGTAFSFLLSAQTQGPANPQAGGYSQCPYAYTSTLNIAPFGAANASDDQYATASHCDCCDANTSCLELNKFNFSVPGSAVIQGIEVEIEKHGSAGANVQDNGLKLTKNGLVTGVSHASSATWPVTDAYSTYGSASDLWGSSWTPAEVNDSTFGIAFAAISYTCFGNNQPSTSYIDHVRITVHYTVSTNVYAVSSDDVVSVYPQPASGGIVNIRLPGTNGKMEAVCYDVTGKKLQQETLESAAAIFTWQLNQPAGIYFLEFRNGATSFRKKIILQ